MRNSPAQMISFVVASPAVTNSGIWFHRRAGSFPSLPTLALSSVSLKIFPVTPFSCLIGKDVACSFKASDLHLYSHLSWESNVKKLQPTKNTDIPASTTDKDVISSDRAALTHTKPSRKGRNPQRLSSSASQDRTPLDNLAIIRYPLKTESSVKATIKSNTLVFIFDRGADKKNIKDTVMKVLKVSIKKVNTLIRPDGSKKAYVVLAPDCNALNVAKMIKFL